MAETLTQIRKWTRLVVGTGGEVGATNPLPTTPGSGGSAAAALTTGQNALSTNNEVVIAANTSRVFCEIKNLDTSITVYIGKDNTLTTANGHGLKAGEAFGFRGYTGAVWAIAASGTPNVSFIEW